MNSIEFRDKLISLFSVIEPLVNKSRMAQFGVSQEEYDRLYKVRYKIEHGDLSGCVVVSSVTGIDEVEEVQYVVTPENRVLNCFLVYEYDFDKLVEVLNECIDTLS